MPTIKDIAQRAGVAHGTVSNVLNKKGNVSSEKINAVIKAAKELGYTMNAQAKQLRQGHCKRVCVIVPRIEMQQYRDLYTSINTELGVHGYDVELYISKDLPCEERQLLEKVAMEHPTAIVVVSSFYKNSNIFNTDIPIFFVERCIKHPSANFIYAGFDYEKAGRELAKRCVEDGAKTCALFFENEKYSHNRYFLEGASEIFEREGCEFQLFNSPYLLNHNSAFEISASLENFDCILMDCEERAKAFMDIQEYIEQPLKIYSLCAKATSANPDITRYELNYQQCGHRIASNIRKLEKEGITCEKEILLKNEGFRNKHLHLPLLEKPEKLNILSLISPTSQALRYLLPQFKRLTNIDVNIVEISYDELYKSVNTLQDTIIKDYDLIRLDMVWLGKFAKKLFREIDPNEETFASIIHNFSPNFPKEFFMVDDRCYALPFDPSVQMLYYRKDLFEDALLNRQFYEMYHRSLHVPKTFEEYKDVAKFFTKKWNPHSPISFGTTMAYGSAQVAASDFLPRLTDDMVQQFHAGALDINTSSIKTLMKEYMDIYPYTDQTMYQWWNHAIMPFAQGKSSMSIVFSNHLSSIVYAHKSKIVGKIGFSKVPGDNPLLGGGVMGISKESGKMDACKSFFKWLYSEKNAAMITYLGGYINHKELVNHADIIELYPWIVGMEKAFSIAKHKNHNFDEIRFKEVLGDAIRSILTRVNNIDDVLEEAQKRLHNDDKRL